MQHSKGLSIGSPFVLLKKKTPVRMSEGGMWGSEIATCRNNRRTILKKLQKMIILLKMIHTHPHKVDCW